MSSQPYPPTGPAPQGPPAAQRPASRPPKAGRGFGLGCLIAACSAFVVLALLVVGVVLLVVATAVGSTGYVGGLHRGVEVQEATVSGTHGAPKVAIIPVRGLLMPGGGLVGATDPGRVLEAMLAHAHGDEAVRAVILAVDSPGGGITTCDVMHRAIKQFRKEAGVPVVVLMEDVAASGGYYVSCAADRIIAHPTTITGSIGVMMPLYDVSRLMQMVGVVDRSVKSGEFKDMGSPFAQKTPEQLQRERQVLDAIISETHERFVQIVAAGRKLDPEVVRALADGRIYTGRQALANKLVDQVGYESDAIEAAKKLARVSEAHVVEYTRLRSLREVLFARARQPNVTVSLDGLPAVPQSREGRLMYLWRPPAPGP